MGGGEVTNSVRFGEQNGPEWVIPREDWDYEYEQFLNWYIENRNLGPQEVAGNQRTKARRGYFKRFYEYFTGRETPQFHRWKLLLAAQLCTKFKPR